MRFPAVAELFVHQPGKPEAAFRLWPSGPVPYGGVIQENRTYIFELRNISNPDSITLSVDNVPLEALRSPNGSTARWQWSTGFYAGLISFTITAPGFESVRFDCITDPDLHKLARQDFDNMVREVLEDTYSLFSLSPFRFPIARGSGKDLPPIARIEFLSSRIEALEAAIKGINSRPVRTMDAEAEWVPYHKAQNVTGEELVRSFKSTRFFRHSESSVLPVVASGMWPAKIRKVRKSERLDTPEHRAIKASLKSWAAWLKVVGERMQSDRVRRGEDVSPNMWAWGRKCTALSNQLYRLLQLPFLQGVSSTASPLRTSSLFRRNPLYRRYFDLHRDFNLGIARIAGDFLNLPLARTFDLYEMWAFLRILRAAVLEIGIPAPDFSSLFNASAEQGSVTVTAGTLVVPLNSRAALSFKRNYREYWLTSDGVGSFTRTMIPDVTLTVIPQSTSPTRIIVLDAKYRIEAQLNEAIASIHMYRDSLVEESESTGVERIVIGAYLISPHRPTVQGSWKDSPMPGRLFHPTYRSEFRFGALMLRPGQSLDEVRASFRTILEDSGCGDLLRQADQSSG